MNQPLTNETIMYELWGIDNEGNQEYSKFTNLNLLKAAIKEYNNNPFIAGYKWTATTILEKGSHNWKKS